MIISFGHGTVSFDAERKSLDKERLDLSFDVSVENGGILIDRVLYMAPSGRN